LDIKIVISKLGGTTYKYWRSWFDGVVGNTWCETGQTPLSATGYLRDFQSA